MNKDKMINEQIKEATKNLVEAIANEESNKVSIATFGKTIAGIGLSGGLDHKKASKSMYVITQMVMLWNQTIEEDSDFEIALKVIQKIRDNILVKLTKDEITQAKNVVKSIEEARKISTSDKKTWNNTMKKLGLTEAQYTLIKGKLGVK